MKGGGYSIKLATFTMAIQDFVMDANCGSSHTASNSAQMPGTACHLHGGQLGTASGMVCSQRKNTQKVLHFINKNIQTGKVSSSCSVVTIAQFSTLGTSRLGLLHRIIIDNNYDRINCETTSTCSFDVERSTNNLSTQRRENI